MPRPPLPWEAGVARGSSGARSARGEQAGADLLEIRRGSLQEIVLGFGSAGGAVIERGGDAEQQRGALALDEVAQDGDAGAAEGIEVEGPDRGGGVELAMAPGTAASREQAAVVPEANLVGGGADQLRELGDAERIARPRQVRVAARIVDQGALVAVKETPVRAGFIAGELGRPLLGRRTPGGTLFEQGALGLAEGLGGEGASPAGDAQALAAGQLRIVREAPAALAGDPVAGGIVESLQLGPGCLGGGGDVGILSRVGI
jgi:hypothetical protein